MYKFYYVAYTQLYNRHKNIFGYDDMWFANTKHKSLYNRRNF